LGLVGTNLCGRRAQRKAAGKSNRKETKKSITWGEKDMWKWASALLDKKGDSQSSVGEKDQI